jgi:ribosome recycling factor
MKLDIHVQLEAKMEKTLSVLKNELQSIRAGRANPQMLDRISADYYGSMTPIKQIASVSAPEPRMIVVQPYDKGALSAIEKAIQSSDLGINPTNDGAVIRLSIPMLTEDRRKDLVKQVKKTGEDAKVAIRNERRHANEGLKKLEKSHELTEDDLKAAESEVQKMTDKYIKTIDDTIEVKEKELLEV